MMAHFQKFMAATLCSVALTSHAQTPASAAPHTYPADAQTPDAQQLSAHLRSKVFTGQIATGASWRLEFQPSGYLFVDVSNGQRDNGPWSTEGASCASSTRAVSHQAAARCVLLPRRCTSSAERGKSSR